jgi:integrase
VAPTSTSTTFRNRAWRPAQKAAGITPHRRVYDLRQTFATFALRAGISTFDLSHYMGTSLAMIDRHYGPTSLATGASTRSGF